MPKIEKTEAESSAELDPEQYRVLRQKAVAPLSGEYDHVFEPGTHTRPTSRSSSPGTTARRAIEVLTTRALMVGAQPVDEGSLV
jgi:hypothetical protein